MVRGGVWESDIPGDRNLVTGPGDPRTLAADGDSSILGRFTTNSEGGFSVGNVIWPCGK